MKKALLLIGWILVIFVLSLMPTSSLSSYPPWPHLDKLAHVVLYGVLTLIGLWKMDRGRIVRPRKMIWLYTLVLGIVLGSLIEVLQGMDFFKRSFDVFDIFANIVGILAMSLAYMLVSKK